MVSKKNSSGTPLVSIIIVNWNGGEIFASCLKSLSKISYPNWELIIVDNGSQDNSGNFVEKYQKINSRIINNHQNLGFAQANNQGYKEAKGEYILLLNNDTKVSPNFLTIMIERMEKDERIGVMQPKIYLMDTNNYLDNAGSFLTKIGFLYHWGFMEKDGPRFNKETWIFSAKGACMLIRKNVIEKVGLFDPDFISYFEESDFCWRVWLYGYKVIYYPKTKIYHKLGFTIRRLDVTNLNYHYFKNRICSLIKNLSTSNLIMVLTPHLFLSCLIMIAFFFKLKPKSSLIIFKSFGWNIINLKKTLDKRKEIQNNRVVTDQLLFHQLSKNINWYKYWNDFKRIIEDFNRKQEKSNA